jgi:hypothetical protein
VNVADPEFELASVIVTSWPPTAESGTVNVTPDGILPDPSVVDGPLKVNGEPPNDAVIAEEAAKPLPDTVTVELKFPLVGLKEIEGVS